MAYLEIRDIKKVYPTGEEALKGVDLDMNAQEVIALLGLSGSGKSTLLRCINRLVEPTSGTVFLDGVEVTAIRHRRQLRAMRQSMGMIFQEFNLVNSIARISNEPSTPVIGSVWSITFASVQINLAAASVSGSVSPVH
jgi:phosphonate transport system ATP-binding protein